MAQVKTLNDIDFRPRLIIGVEGEKNSGKTVFGVSAALFRPPLTLMRLDFASKGALRAAKENGLEGSIRLLDYDVDIARDLEAQAFAAKKLAKDAKGKSQREVQQLEAEAERQLAEAQSRAQIVAEDFRKDYAAALSLGGTVMIDTFTEVYDMERLALFGMLRQVPQLQYEKSSKAMLHYINMAEQSESNLIVLNKLKDEWITGADNKKYKSGKMVTDGWDKLEFPAHIMLRLYRAGTKSDPTRTGAPLNAPGAFYMQFLKCNDKAEDDLTGTVHQIESALMGFNQVGELVFGKEWNG